MIQSDRDSKESTISIPRRPGCVAEGGALDILDISVDFPFVLDDFLSFCFIVPGFAWDRLPPSRLGSQSQVFSELRDVCLGVWVLLCALHRGVIDSFQGFQLVVMLELHNQRPQPMEYTSMLAVKQSSRFVMGGRTRFPSMPAMRFSWKYMPASSYSLANATCKTSHRPATRQSSLTLPRVNHFGK